MPKIELHAWDPVEHLHDHQDCIGYLDVALEEDDPVLVFEVLGDIARFKGMNEVAEALGDNSGQIFEAPSAEQVAQLGVVLKALRALGLSFYAGPRRDADQYQSDEESPDISAGEQQVAD